MKILDRYILFEFLKNFISTLCILLLIFVFYTIWQFIDEFAGRGLEMWIIFKFILLYIPHLTPIIVPLTIILSSVMTFGALSESYEFAAMKASGVSLLRTMRVLSVLIGIISLGVFFLSNNVIPLANEKVVDMRLNIAKVKPSMAIQEGIFSNIGDEISIKVDRKTGDKDQFLKQVIIHKKTPDRVNRVVIHASEGELINRDHSALIQLILKNGNYYEDVETGSYERQKRRPFAKADFEKYVMNIDLSSLNKVNIEERNNVSTYRMMNVNELKSAIDSSTYEYRENLTAYGESLYRRTGILYLNSSSENNSVTEVPDMVSPKEQQNVDTVTSVKQLLSLYEDWKLTQLYDMAIENNISQLTNYQYKKEDIDRRNRQLNMYYITLNSRFALSVSCLVLFLVSVPLGAIIRKGGLGLPLVVAMGLFLTYHFVGMFLNKFAEDGTISPILSPWISIFLLLPIGIFLTYKVSTDKPVI